MLQAVPRAADLRIMSLSSVLVATNQTVFREGCVLDKRILLFVVDGVPGSGIGGRIDRVVELHAVVNRQEEGW